jgi:hypothetical protein
MIENQFSLPFGKENRLKPHIYALAKTSRDWWAEGKKFLNKIQPPAEAGKISYYW